MQYSIDLIERSLKIWGFDIDEIEIEKIKHIAMHQYQISNQDKTLLYIDNLQCCVGLYAYGNNFAFAAHINTVVFDNNEYYLDKNRKPIHCNRCDDLYKSILNFNGIINEPFKIGIAFGCSPLNNCEESIVLIYKGINDIIKKLNYLDMPVIKLEDIVAPEFILDSQTGNIIVPNKKIKGNCSCLRLVRDKKSR